MQRTLNYRKKILMCFFVVVLVLVTFSGIINYLNARKLIMDDARQQSTSTITQLKNSNDMLLESLEQSLLAMTSNVDIEMFGLRYQYIQNYKEKNSVYDKLAGALNMNPYFTSCYVYYPKQESLIDMNSYSPKYESINENLEKDKVLAAYDAYEKDSIKENAPIYAIMTSPNTYEWMIVLPVNTSHQAPKCLLMVTIDSDCFFQNLNALSLRENSKVYISDAKNQWIGSLEPSFMSKPSTNKKALNNSTGNFITDIDGKKQLIIFVSSQTSGWKYFYTIPLTSIYEKVMFLFQMELVIALLCAVIGFLLAFVLTGKIYFPIKKISRKFSTGINQNNKISDKDYDAISAIELGVDQLVNDNKTLQQQLSENLIVLKNTFLRQLLDGNLEKYESVFECFESYNIHFPDDCLYMVLILTSEHDFNKSTNAHDPQILALGIYLEDYLENDKLLHEKMYTQIVKIDCGAIAIILGVQNLTNASIKTMSFINKMRNDIGSFLKKSITIGCSNFTNDISEIPILFKNASASAEYRFILGGDRTILFRELPETMTSTYSYPWNIEKNILYYLRQGQLEPTISEIEKFTTFICENIADINRYRFAFIHLLTDIIKNFEELNLVYLNDIDQNSIYRDILSCSSSSFILDLFKKFAIDICEIINQKKCYHTDEIALAACKFIDENFTSPDMSLDMLAQQLEFSVSYISKVFKLSMGISIKEHITEKRINLACELLENSDKKLREIAESVGYLQQRSFIEIFKKYKDVTPSDYRKSKRRCDFV